MGVQLDISWEGRSAKDYSRFFVTAAAIDDFREPLEDVAQDVIAPSIAANFDAGGRPSWTPLAESTVAKKSSMGVSNPGKILFHTGALEEAATNPSNYQVSKSELVAAPFGVDYWIHHQTGTEHVPQRVIMKLQAQDRTAITRIMANWIRTHMIFDPRLPGARVPGGR